MFQNPGQRFRPPRFRLKRARCRALRAWAVRMVPIAQQAGAAAVAWWLARWIGAHPEPLFAPLAAFIALNAPAGERGRNALRLLTGVVIGIITGELFLSMLGNAGYSLALAALTGAGIAAALGGARIVIAQAAAGAILTVASSQGDIGLNRLQDALVGGGVALVFSQFLFTPEPVGFLRRGQSALLGSLASAMEDLADAVGDDVEWKERRAIDGLRDVRNNLAAFATLRRSGASLARHTVSGQVRRADARVEYEGAVRLDALVESCLVLARLVIEDAGNRPRQVLPLTELAAIIRQLARGLDEASTREEAAGRMIELYHETRTSDEAHAAIRMAVRMIAGDMLAYIGVERPDIEVVLRGPETSYRVPGPPETGVIPRMPWRGRED